MPSRLGIALVAGLSLVVAPIGASVGAQAPSTPASQGLTLQAVVDATIVGNTQIRNERYRADGFRGQLLSKASPFDVQYHTAMQQGRDNQQLQDTKFVAQNATTYEMSLSRQLRSGVSLSPSLQVTKSQYLITGAPTTGLASAGLGINVPLLYDRGGAVTTTAETVAQLDLETILGSWRNIVVTNVGSTVAAYWSYVAAVARLDAQVEAEVRGERLLDETTMLVKKEERAPADLQQLRANVASKRGARILAEQAVVEARVQLGTAMGLTDPALVTGLPAPATSFPTPVDDATMGVTSVARLVDTARSHRFDLAAQRVSIRAWELELREFRSATLPRLDLNVNLGYQGFTAGPGFSHLISPIYRNVPGLNATIQFRYDGSVANSAARGRVIQEEASLGQQRVGLRDVERQVVTDVQVAAAGVDRNAMSLRESEQAVEFFRKSVDNEKRKLQLGMNTLFEVLNAEDALTNAQLNAINTRRTYATALASLRAATGTLVDIVADTPRVDAARLLSVP